MYSSIVLGVGFMGSSGIAMYLWRDRIGSIFTSDPEVIKLVGILAPIASLFSIVDGLVGVCGGVFRGLGRQKVTPSHEPSHGTHLSPQHAPLHSLPLLPLPSLPSLPCSSYAPPMPLPFPAPSTPPSHCHSFHAPSTLLPRFFHAPSTLFPLSPLKVVTLVNVFAFWLLGIPLGAILAFPLHWRVEGLWWGLCLGLVASSLAYAVLICRLDWQKEAQLALRRSTVVPEAEERSGGKATPLLSAEEREHA